MPATITLSQLARTLGAEVDRGSADPVITRVSSIAAAGPGCLVFAEEEASLAAALASSAAAVLVSTQVGNLNGSKPVLRLPQPRLAFAQAAVLLRGARPSPSVHATAVVAPGVQIGGASRLRLRLCGEGPAFARTALAEAVLRPAPPRHGRPPDRQAWPPGR